MLEALLRRLNPSARILPATHAEVPRRRCSSCAAVPLPQPLPQASWACTLVRVLLRATWPCLQVDLGEVIHTERFSLERAQEVGRGAAAAGGLSATDSPARTHMAAVPAGLPASPV